MENNISIPELFGSHVFNEEVMKKRLPKDVAASLLETIDAGSELDAGIADTVASVMKEWAIELGATHYTHWFQPLNGVTAEKHESFLVPTGSGKGIMEFSGKELIRGEPDASSFPSGGLRATFEARGYTSWDPASYAFVKDGSLYIPTVFCSYTGDSLDSKTPLLRSIAAINREALRITKLFGIDAKRVLTYVGPEQEYFLIDEKDYKKRLDLYYCGRTLFGAPAVKGQELDDHYFGALRPRVSAFMSELDRELWTLGICAKTKHNETAPAQHELAPVYTSANTAIDQNLLTMELMKKIAPKYGMECLLSEKPFSGINGSGKHNNWSIGTDTGINLLKPGKSPENNKQFLLVLAAVLKAVDDYQDLLRISASSAGNDRRLGGNEAPPTIISVFLGEELEAIVNAIADGTPYEKHDTQFMSLGIDTVAAIKKDKTDRNRTSPFAFTGNKFEFRMVGSSQNCALANIVINTAVAKSFADFADVLEKADDFDAALDTLLAATFKEHRRIIFSGNSYSKDWETEAKERGLLCLRTAPDAFARFADKKNVELFKKFGVMSENEMFSRREILFENYRKVIAIEARTMIEMTLRDIIPAVCAYIGDLANTLQAKTMMEGVDTSVEKDLIAKLSTLESRIYSAVHDLKVEETAVFGIEDEERRCYFERDRVIPAMDALRIAVDAAEGLTARSYWPMPTYGDLTFRV